MTRSTTKTSRSFKVSFFLAVSIKGLMGFRHERFLRFESPSSSKAHFIFFLAYKHNEVKGLCIESLSINNTDFQLKDDI